MRSSSTVIPPSGEGADAAVALAPVCAENRRSHTFLRTTVRRAAQRSAWPPTRPNMVGCTGRSISESGKYQNWVQTLQTRRLQTSSSARSGLTSSSPIAPQRCRLFCGHCAICAELASRFVTHLIWTAMSRFTNRFLQEYGHQMQVRFSPRIQEMVSIAGFSD